MQPQSDRERNLPEHLIEELRQTAPGDLSAYGYGAIRAYVESPVAFTPVERLSRIRAVVEAVEKVRAERQ